MCLRFGILFVWMVMGLPVFAQACEKNLNYETMVLEQGKFTYPVQKEDEDVYSPSYCPNKTCTCVSDVSYIRFAQGNAVKGITPINLFLQKEAEQNQCSYGITETSFKPEVTYAGDGYISLYAENYGLPTGGNGSCHGGYVSHTFDTRTGREILLKDILKASDLPAIRKAIAEYIASSRANDEGKDRKAIESDLVRMQDKELLSLGFYIKNEEVYTNTNNFYFSCAEGNNFPARIPQSLITDKTLIKAIHTTNAECN